MMEFPEMTATRRERLILPALAGFYHSFAQPFGWLAFRLVIGGALLSEGWPKILAPMGQAGFIENVLGLPAGWFFSPLLAIVQCVGGALIALGLLTRPAALANALMLLVTLWFHVANPYGEAFLTAEGLEFLKANAAYLTPQGQVQLLRDGGSAFLTQVQTKAVLTSTFWSAACALIAAYGGGRFAFERLMRREF